MSRHTSTLPTRALGTTGMEITRVGFGAWAIGGGGWAFAWGSQDDDVSRQLLPTISSPSRGRRAESDSIRPPQPATADWN